MTTRVARSRPCRNTFGTEGQLLVNRHAEQLIYKKSAGFKTIDTAIAENMKHSNGIKTKIAAKTVDHEAVRKCATKIIFELDDLIKTLQIESHGDNNNEVHAIHIEIEESDQEKLKKKRPIDKEEETTYSNGIKTTDTDLIDLK